MLLLILLSFFGLVYSEKCKIYRVRNNDSCHIISIEKSISINDIETWNENNWTWKGCHKLEPGQVICVSPGDPPKDPRPKILFNGRCFAYEVQSGDSCWSISDDYNISIDDIEIWNENTFHWEGCSNLQYGMRICLSEGLPPLPKIDKNAQCGITAADRNADCPLNVCCSKWGYCGTTEEFCGEGCQSNCEMGIQYDDLKESDHFYKIGYYTEWNIGRKGSVMYIEDIVISEYTHIHYAFASITKDFEVHIEKIDLFKKFTALQGVKKILSFGGWTFNDSPTEWIFSVMAKYYQDRFIKNILQFLEKYDIDGIDLDWEYPVAPERGGSDSDKENYVSLVAKLRESMDKRYSLSIAAPASYWYLRGFNIKEMAVHLDYIVYMTYDFHGQWDYGNKWTGPYLKSHVDWQETLNAIALITKAGVPSYKVLLGIAYYGRSFKQVDSLCHEPHCKFSNKPANPGPYTETGGFLSLNEINLIEKIRYKKYDENSDTMILLYDDDQWVSYTTPEINNKRAARAKELKLGGIVIWAMDLAPGGTGINPDVDISSDTTDCMKYVYNRFPFAMGIWISGTIPIPQECNNVYIAYNLVQSIYGNLNHHYQLANSDGYERKFNLYAKQYRIHIEMEIVEYNRKNCDEIFRCYQDGKEIKCEKYLRWNTFFPKKIHLELIDEEKYFKDILEKFFVSKENIKFTDDTQTCGIPGDSGEEIYYCTIYNFPILYNLDIQNPKDKGIELKNRFADIGKTAITSLTLDLLNPDDIIDAMLPLNYLASSYCDTMKDIIRVADEIEENERRNQAIIGIELTLHILTIATFGISGPAAMALSAIIFAGGISISIYEISIGKGIEEIIMPIFDLLLSFGGSILSRIKKIGKSGRRIKGIFTKHGPKLPKKLTVPDLDVKRLICI